jgi:hypothetical protein
MNDLAATLSRAGQYALAKLGSEDFKALNPEIQQKYDDRTLRFADSHIFTTKGFPNTANKLEVFKEDDRIIDGVRNISNSTLETPRAAFIDRIYVLIGWSSQENMEREVRYTNLVYNPHELTTTDIGGTSYVQNAIQITPQLENAELNFAVNRGYPILQDHPLRDFFIQANSQTDDSNGYFQYDLEIPKILPTDQPLRFDINLPQDTALSSEPGYYYVRVGFRGVELVPER